MSVPIVFYGDDFTGATDTLATATMGGRRTMLFLGVPTFDQLNAAGPLDCLGIAGTARALSPDEMVAELTPVARCFADLAPDIVHYKTCSTFDSAPHVGNIAAAIDIFRQALPLDTFLPIVGGQPNLGRYCLFGNLFAAYQTGGEVFRIDRHPTMSRHPVTPMFEADLRQHLSTLGLPDVANVPWPILERPIDEAAAAIDAVIDRAIGPVLFDAARSTHLPVIGQAIRRRRREGQSILAVGPSSVVQCLIDGDKTLDHRTYTAHASPQLPKPATATGPVLVMSGSLSPVTAEQIRAASDYEHISLSASALMADDHAHLDHVRMNVLRALESGRHVLVQTTGSTIAAAGSLLAQAGGRWLNHLLIDARPSRLGLAGGDTSSFGVRALDIWGLSYAGQIAPGVPLCVAHADHPALDRLPVMLKGGQMGPVDIFARLLG